MNQMFVLFLGFFSYLLQQHTGGLNFKKGYFERKQNSFGNLKILQGNGCLGKFFGRHGVIKSDFRDVSDFWRLCLPKFREDISDFGGTFLYTWFCSKSIC